jgi:glycosyltransferase involved in cell wall biosynthesis
MIKFTVILISYNQEKTIKRAIDSILKQSRSEYSIQIIVSDDCSTDNTWNILKKYKDSFPDIFTIKRNKINLGIYDNYQSTYKHVAGDMVLSLAGDDEICSGYFLAINSYIKSQIVDAQKDRFVILADHISVYPDGREFYHSNKHVKRYEPKGLKIRGIINNYSLSESVNNFKCRHIMKYIDEPGYLYTRESMVDLQPYLSAEKVYHLAIPGVKYYASIGVSITLDENYFIKGKSDFIKHILQTNIFTSRADREWLELELATISSLNNGNIYSYVIYFIKILKNIAQPYSLIIVENKIRRLLSKINYSYKNR